MVNEIAVDACISEEEDQIDVSSSLFFIIKSNDNKFTVVIIRGTLIISSPTEPHEERKEKVQNSDATPGED